MSEQQQWKTRDRTSVSFYAQCPWCGSEIDGYNNLMSNGGGRIEGKCDCGAQLSVHFAFEAP